MVDGVPTQLNLWDTAGQEEYDRLRPLSYPSAEVFLLCFSLVNHASFDDISNKWYPEVKHHCPNTPLVLIGTKCDLTIVRSVLFYEAVQKKKEIGAVRYLECSAKRNEGLQEVFEVAARSARTAMKKRTCIIL